MLLLGSTSASTELMLALGSMVNQVTLRHFATSRCVCVMTESDSEMADYLQLDLPVFQVQNSFESGVAPHFLL